MQYYQLEKNKFWVGFMINVMIADDQELICQSLEIVIKSKSDMKVVAIASNGWETIDLAKKYKTTIDTLVKLNDIEDADSIYVGDKIMIPGRAVL